MVGPRSSKPAPLRHAGSTPVARSKFMKMPANYHTPEFQNKYGRKAFEFHIAANHGHSGIISPDWDDAPPASTGLTPCNCFERAMIAIDRETKEAEERARMDREYGEYDFFEDMRNG